MLYLCTCPACIRGEGVKGSTCGLAFLSGAGCAHCQWAWACEEELLAYGQGKVVQERLHPNSYSRLLAAAHLVGYTPLPARSHAHEAHALN